MIEAAEDLLWAGARPQPKVAILSPKSSEMWEAKSTPIPTVVLPIKNPTKSVHHLGRHLCPSPPSCSLIFECEMRELL